VQNYENLQKKVDEIEV